MQLYLEKYKYIYIYSFEVFDMKKILSVLLSVVIAVCAFSAVAMPAMAFSVLSPGGRVDHVVNDPLVNNRKSNQVSGHAVTPGENVITFTYSGDGDFKGWQIVDKNGNIINISENDPSYRIVSQDGKTLTIEVLDWSKWESPDGYTVTAVTAGGTTDGDKDSGNKSPGTGAVSVAFASMAAAGAGVAILGLTKKRDAE
jgi:ABC-type oligopeptide transport system substrate-binding subunit